MAPEIRFLRRGQLLEIACRLCVAHPHIVQFRELFLTQSHLAIVMEFAAGGDMFDYVIKHKGSGGFPALLLQSQQQKPSGRQEFTGAHAPAGPGEGLPETLARRFFQQLIFALDFCQRQGIANRSVNMLLTPLSRMTSLAGMYLYEDTVKHSACMQKY